MKICQDYNPSNCLTHCKIFDDPCSYTFKGNCIVRDEKVVWVHAEPLSNLRTKLNIGDVVALESTPYKKGKLIGYGPCQVDIKFGDKQVSVWRDEVIRLKRIEDQ